MNETPAERDLEPRRSRNGMRGTSWERGCRTERPRLHGTSSTISIRERRDRRASRGLRSHRLRRPQGSGKPAGRGPATSIAPRSSVRASRGVPSRFLPATAGAPAVALRESKRGKPAAIRAGRGGWVQRSYQALIARIARDSGECRRQRACMDVRIARRRFPDIASCAQRRAASHPHHGVSLRGFLSPASEPADSGR